jgi:hypothetical protein
MLSYVEQSPKKRPGCDYNSPCSEVHTDISCHAGYATVAIDQDFRNRQLFKIQSSGSFQESFQSELIGLLIALNSWCPDTGSLGSIQKTKLDPGGVSVGSHRAAQRVDLSDNVSFG